MNARNLVMAFALLGAGCASYSGSSLVPGRSTAGDVEALMGAPDEKVALAGGATEWFYPRQPFGRQTFAITLDSRGVVRSVEQRLTEENLKKISIGATTRQEVRALFGPPYMTSRLERQQRDVWQYTVYNSIQDKYDLYVQFSYDGVVQEVLMLRDYRDDPGDHGDRSSLAPGTYS